jgi:SAM-dependent methyltransferase
MHDFLSVLEQSLNDGTCLALVLSRPGAAGGSSPRRISVRPVQLRGERRWQWTLQFARGESHENLTAGESFSRAATLLNLDSDQTAAPGTPPPVAGRLPNGHPAFAHAHLFTTGADFALRIGRRGVPHVMQSAPTRACGDTAHDRRKQYLIPEGVPCPFLAEIGVMTPAGQVRSRYRAKFRQINRFLEFVEDIYAELPPDGPLNVIDFGCGRSSLTFALHHLLTHVHRREVRIVGLDREQSVIDRCRAAAGRLELNGLEFHVGDIAHHNADRPVDLAVSLHACDTATDDALARAVEWGTQVILAAPCCQHELAAHIESEPLSLLLSHGILRERFAALSTDALRACALEIAGYRTQVLEFIDLEHTPKNVLIRAVRRSQRTDDVSARRRFDEFKRLLGLERLHLEQALRLDAWTPEKDSPPGAVSG